MVNVACIIVSYNPDYEKLNTILESLLFQEIKIILVKNSQEPVNLKFDLINRIICIQLCKNMGIAYAQNVGIAEARKLESNWILFSDQDTKYPGNYVQKLISISCEHKLKNIGALCPVFFDEIRNSYGALTVGKTKLQIPEIGRIYELAHTISSGTLVPVSILDQVGGMDEKLFIDFVDNEWCWRLNSYGYKIYCITDVCIHHQLGDKIVKKFGIKIVSRSQMRFYYIIRNGYYLTKTHYLSKSESFKYKLMLFKKMLEFILLYGFSVKNIEFLKKAKKNGLKNKFIPYEEI